MQVPIDQNSYQQYGDVNYSQGRSMGLPPSHRPRDIDTEEIGRNNCEFSITLGTPNQSFILNF